MSHLSKSEVIDEMVSEGYDYESAYRMVYGDTLNFNDSMANQEPNCEEAFDEFYGAKNGYINERDRECYNNDNELDILARADEAAAYNENQGEDND